jgi:AcrR family transcriptional regulator
VNAPLRRRRTSADVHALILAAAGEAFAKKGYSGARLSAIAEAAGVSKSALFRHFATKEELFSAAALQPFRDFAGHWENFFESAGTEDVTDEQVVMTYVEALVNLVGDHRDAVRAYIFDEAMSQDAMETVMVRLIGIGKLFAAERAVDISNLELRVRCAVAMVVSVAAVDGWIHGYGHLSRAEVAREMAIVVHRGVLG